MRMINIYHCIKYMGKEGDYVKIRNLCENVFLIIRQRTYCCLVLIWFICLTAYQPLISFLMSKFATKYCG